MKNKKDLWNFKDLLIKQIKKQGGWVNSHVHADRAFTITPKKLDIYERYVLEQKWDIVDEVKINATVDDYYKRVSQAIELMISQGVTAVGSFIDIDPACEDRAIKGALKAREKYKKVIQIKFINQTLKGVIEPKARYWFDRGTPLVDIIGGLPRRDERDYGKGKEHLDILLSTAKKYHKLVHVHVDQFNNPNDKETEILCDKTIKHDMVGQVVAIHCISIASHPKIYREKIYKKMKKAKLMVIACPTAWIDSHRTEISTPFHNSLTPIDEMIPYGIPVALGTDNITDYMVPFCDGDMWSELKLLATGNRYTNFSELVKIATINGLKVLDLL